MNAIFKNYGVELTGTMPGLMHADDLDWRASMEAWRSDPENKKKSKAGDDRSPAWTWIGGLYHDGTHVGCPADNLMTALREGGARVPVPGKKNLTYKRQSQSGLVVNEILWPIVTKLGKVPFAEIDALRNNDDFALHQETARRLGFELFAKGARVGQSKHVRVRAKFTNWKLAGTITVFDETITQSVLESILTCSGRYCGLFDWRPSSPKSPGPYGTFTATVKEIQQ